MVKGSRVLCELRYTYKCSRKWAAIILKLTTTMEDVGIIQGIASLNRLAPRM